MYKKSVPPFYAELALKENQKGGVFPSLVPQDNKGPFKQT
jgi:hypothetical protein